MIARLSCFKETETFLGRFGSVPQAAKRAAMTEDHCEAALRQIQRVVTIASSDDPPITVGEALEQIVETLDLAGFGPVAAEQIRAHLSQMGMQ